MKHNFKLQDKIVIPLTPAEWSGVLEALCAYVATLTESPSADQIMGLVALGSACPKSTYPKDFLKHQNN